MTKKVLRIRKYKSVLWKKYHNSGSYNDLCEYKRVLYRATSEYKKAKYSFEKILASNVKLIISPFMHMLGQNPKLRLVLVLSRMKMVL